MEFRRWDELLLDPHGPHSVRWAKIKTPQRAVEKTVRSYGQDPSYLVDLCRQTIFFLTPADLCSCLRDIIADPVCSPFAPCCMPTSCI